MAVLRLDRTAGVPAGLQEVPAALSAVRARSVALVEGLAPTAWRGPSRCHLWTVHDVLRHVRDACRVHVGVLRRDPSGPFDQPFDNRETPRRWLDRSTGETPAETMDDLRRWSEAEAPALHDRLDLGDQDPVAGPYGPIPWTVLTMHAVWDAWLHDRDIAHLTGGGLPSTAGEDAVVAAYGLFIASMVAALQRQHFEVTVALAGDGHHHLATVAPGHVEIRTVPAPAAAELRGDLGQVVDSLAGRGPGLADVLEGDPERWVPLTGLRAILAPQS